MGSENVRSRRKTGKNFKDMKNSEVVPSHLERRKGSLGKEVGMSKIPRLQNDTACEPLHSLQTICESLV